MTDPTQIPKQIIDLAKETASQPIARFSEFISQKLFGKPIARLKAEAENEYEKTKQRGEIERKAQEPFIVQIETAKAYRQYSNLGSTLKIARELITSSENKISDDNDVFWGFIEHSKEISNEQTQGLIAKIIAGEYNSPGLYSMSTLQIVKMLGKNELKLFENIACLLLDSVQIPEELFELGENAKKLMDDLGVDFEDLQILQSLGLFLPDDMTRTIQNPEKKNFVTNYQNKKLTYAAENEKSKIIHLPNFFRLSMVGEQLLRHLKPKYVEGYFVWLKLNYKISNYKL